MKNKTGEEILKGPKLAERDSSWQTALSNKNDSYDSNWKNRPDADFIDKHSYLLNEVKKHGHAEDLACLMSLQAMIQRVRPDLFKTEITRYEHKPKAQPGLAGPVDKSEPF